MSDLHPDHVTPVLALEDQDACSPLVLRSAGLQAANIIRKLTNDLGYKEQAIAAAERDRDAAKAEAERLREALERLASMEGLTGSFRMGNIAEAAELRARTDYARAALQEKTHD